MDTKVTQRIHKVASAYLICHGQARNHPIKVVVIKLDAIRMFIYPRSKSAMTAVVVYFTSFPSLIQVLTVL
jgi:hypothetical protein